MSTHPVIPERLEDEDWIDWWMRVQAAVTDNPPPAPPGFVLLPCEATPRHQPIYMLDDGESTDYLGCIECSNELYAADHRTCHHDVNHRGRWRRWKLSHKAVGWLYTLGVVSSSGTRFGGGCNNCLHGVRWSLFRGPYVLFVPRETWRCWRNGHRRGEEIGMGFCGKCLPQPCCGNTGSGHNDDCDQKDVF